MNSVWQIFGRIAFWLSWPLLWVYLQIGRRTRIIVHQKDKVLLVKTWLGSGGWKLPGGGLRRDESALKGVIREVHEETGLTLEEKDIQEIDSGTVREQGIPVSFVLFSARVSSSTVRLRRGELVDIAWLPLADIYGRPDVDKTTKHLLSSWKNKP